MSFFNLEQPGVSCSHYHLSITLPGEALAPQPDTAMQILLSKGAPATTPCATLPSNLQKFKIPHARREYGEAAGGTFLVQHLGGELCHFWHHRYHILRPTTLYLKVPATCVLLLFTLSGDAHCSGANETPEKMKAGYCHCFCVPEGLYTMHFDPGNYTFAQTELLPTALPLLKLAGDSRSRLQEYIQTPSDQSMHLHCGLLNTNLRQLLLEIQNCPYNDKESQQLYYEDKVHQLIIRFSLELTSKPKKNIKIPPARLREIRDYIHIASAEHFVTVDELILKFAFCRTILTAAFKEHFGLTVGRYILKVRMEMARDLVLQTNDPITEIADRVHYEHLSAFSRAFRASHRYSPKKYRKLHKIRP